MSFCMKNVSVGILAWGVIKPCTSPANVAGDLRVLNNVRNELRITRLSTSGLNVSPLE